MKAVFPGKPQAKLNAVDTVRWEGRRIVCYISGSSLLILRGSNDLLQTISHREEEQLTAVAISDLTGKIVICTSKTVYVYRPFGQDFGAPQWSLQHVLTLTSGDQSLNSLSWGLGEELLVAGSSLTLFATAEPPREVWTKRPANAVKYASLSPDASLIATTGWRDRLVKIWKRIVFGQGMEKFDVSYLPHPATVTGLHWHTRPGPEQHTDTVLYTTCADHKLRVWAHTDPHGLQELQLWAEIDLVTCVESLDSVPKSEKIRRYVVVMDKWQFENLVERAAATDGLDEHSIGVHKHLVDIAYRDPDICVVLDDRGNMSAWGLERVGCKARHAQDIFKIIDIQGLPVHFAQDAGPEEDYMQPRVFEGEGSDCSLNLLLNFFDGRLQWLRSPIDRLFDASEEGPRFEADAEWTGHSEPIEKLFASKDQGWLLSVSTGGEVVCWDQRPASAVTLVRRSVMSVSRNILHVCLLPDGEHAILLHDASLSLWAFKPGEAVQVANRDTDFDGEPLTMFLAGEASINGSRQYYVAVTTSALLGVVWLVSPTSDKQTVTLDYFIDYGVDEIDKVSQLVVPFPLTAITNHTFPLCAQSPGGQLRMFDAVLDIDGGSFDWAEVNDFATSVDDPSIISSSSTGKVAIVDRPGTTLDIWDSSDGFLEYTETFSPYDPILMLDWTVTSQAYAMLAVGFAHKAFLYGQRRFDYLENQAAWVRLREINISPLTNLYVADCIWLQQTEVLVAAGNQMFLFGNRLDVPKVIADDLMLPLKSEQQHDISDVVAALNAGFAVYHPGFIAHSIAAGKIKAIQKALMVLHKTLKFYTEGDALDSFLGLTCQDFGERVHSTQRPTHRRRMSYLEYSSEEEASSIDSEIATSLSAKLLEVRLPFITKNDQTRLANFVESIGFVEKHRLSVDEWGLRYLVFFQETGLRLNIANATVEQLSWRETVWAYHCTNQEVLVDLTSKRYNGRMQWVNARECGMFMWMTDLSALRTHFENIARNEYTKTDERNPIDCTLYYLALRKKQVLIGLWRMATWNREQGATQRLLANNFSDSKWQTAAQKNAYALLGRRRFEYAAAFFLLADRLKDAVGILAGQLDDIQLAVAVARVYEGDDGPVLKGLLEERILPRALQTGDRWLAHWAFSMLARHDDATKCLVFPLSTSIDQHFNDPVPQASKSFLKEDPSLVVLYQYLRDSPQRALYRKSTTPPVKPEEEWEFVLKMAKLYSRAGCDVLALDLVRTWRLPAPTPPKRIPQSSGTANPTQPPAIIPNGNADSAPVNSPVLSPTSPRLSFTFPHGPGPQSPSLTRRRSSFMARRPSISQIGRRSSILEESVFERDEDKGKNADGEQEKKVSMKMGLLDGEAKRKVVVEEPSASSIFDSFNF